jgi:hypothetical protein
MRRIELTTLVMVANLSLFYALSRFFSIGSWPRNIASRAVNQAPISGKHEAFETRATSCENCDLWPVPSNTGS